MQATEKKRLLKVRKRINAGRPDFVRQESWRYKRLHPPWRRPRGIDNRVRRRKKGWPDSPKVGYRSPRAVRTLHPSGLKEVIIYNVKDLSSVDPEKELVRIGAGVGARKRALIVPETERLGIRVVNSREEVKKSESEE